MRLHTSGWWRAVLMAVLIAGLGIAPTAWNALAQQPGPVRPPSPAQPEQPSPPQGQSSQPQPPQPPPSPQATISVQSNVVDVDAIVTDHDGNFVTGLKRQNFRVFDDGQPQQIVTFAPTDAPITIVILLEYSALERGWYSCQGASWADEFLDDLKPQDWVALKTFDLHTTLQVDFTRNKRKVENAIGSLGFPLFDESVLFDAMYQTLDQLRDVKGKKSILLIASGVDTLSKHNLNQVLNRLKETEVTVFAVDTAQGINLFSPDLKIAPSLCIVPLPSIAPNPSIAEHPIMAYLQAKNQLSAFARATGGRAFFPEYRRQLPNIFSGVAASLRDQYRLAFLPNTPPDGKYHKLKVEVVDAQGNPLKLVNKKGKKQKVNVYARQGYTAPSAAATQK